MTTKINLVTGVSALARHFFEAFRRQISVGLPAESSFHSLGLGGQQHFNGYQ